MPARRIVIVGLCAALGACGFRPLLTADDGPQVRAELEAVEIQGLGGRLGQLVQNALLDELQATGAAGAPRYILTVQLQSYSDAFAIQFDNTITRYNLTLIADFQLKRREDQQVLYESAVQRVTSYNVIQQPFATLTAEQAAERRAAEEVGNNIRTLLAVYFAREQDQA
jgi:LPS-assembly lipoprotein